MPVLTMDIEMETCSRCQARVAEPCRSPNGEVWRDDRGDRRHHAPRIDRAFWKQQRRQKE